MNIPILFPFVLACAVLDLRTKRIPNNLILCGLAGAVLLRGALLFQSPCSPSACLLRLADGCAGFLLPWLILGPLAALKMFGGGDVKLLSVIGLCLGAGNCLRIMWYSLLIAAAWSVFLVIRKRNLAQRLHYLYRYVGQSIVTGKLRPYRAGSSMVSAGRNAGLPADVQENAADSSGEFCFAVPVLIALIIWMSFF